MKNKIKSFTYERLGHLSQKLVVLAFLCQCRQPSVDAGGHSSAAPQHSTQQSTVFT